MSLACAPPSISKAPNDSAPRRRPRPAVSLGAVLALSASLLSWPRSGAGAGDGALAGGRLHSDRRPAAAPRAVGLRAVQPCTGGAQIDRAVAASAAAAGGGESGGGEGGDAAAARVLVLSFSLSRCGPCKLMDPKVEDLARDFDGRAQFIKIVGDRDPDGMRLLSAFGVRGVPAYHIFNQGQQVSTIMGAKPKKLRRTLEGLVESGDARELGSKASTIMGAKPKKLRRTLEEYA